MQIGEANTFRREYDRANDYYRQAIEMAPDYYNAYLFRGYNAYCQKGPAAAVADLEKAAALDDFTQTEIGLTIAYLNSGRTEDALKIVNRFRELSPHRYVPAILFWGVYWRLGDKDRAFKWLNKALDDRSAYLVSLNFPVYDDARDDPRFQAIYKKVGLPP